MSFKVICIEKEKPDEPHSDLINAANKLIVGDPYTVVGVYNGLYELAEFPHPRQILWYPKNFVPISEIDETTFERNYQKELV